MLFWARQVVVVMVLGLSVHLFPGLSSTPKALSEFYEKQWPRREVLLQEWRTGRAGETVLPPKVQAMLALLRENRVESYRYSDTIAQDPDTSVVQRIAEGAYPIRWSANARHVLLSSSEPLVAMCKAVASRQEVVLAHCS